MGVEWGSPPTVPTKRPVGGSTDAPLTTAG